MGSGHTTAMDCLVELKVKKATGFQKALYSALIVSF